MKSLRIWLILLSSDATWLWYFPPIEIIKDWIVRPLKDQHVKPKATATFKCELFKDTPNWKWLKGENEATPSDKIEIKKDGKELTLTIKNCQPDDVADYSLEVEGRVYTAKLTLGGSYLFHLSSSNGVYFVSVFYFCVLTRACRAGGSDPYASGQCWGHREGRRHVWNRDIWGRRPRGMEAQRRSFDQISGTNRVLL